MTSGWKELLYNIHPQIWKMIEVLHSRRRLGKISSDADPSMKAKKG